jgi:hypothetical protein
MGVGIWGKKARGKPGFWLADEGDGAGGGGEGEFSNFGVIIDHIA